MRSEILCNYVARLSCLTSKDGGDSIRLHSSIEDYSAIANLGAPGLYRILTRSECLDAFSSIRNDLYNRDRGAPLIHIDSHGSESNGLQFSDGSELNWEELAIELAQINKPLKNELCVLACVCEGFFMNRAVRVTSASPYGLALAPVSKKDNGAIEDAARAFYEHLLLDLDILTAMKAAHPTFDSFSSESLLLKGLVHMVRKHRGKTGKTRRENLLTRAVDVLGDSTDLRELRKRIKSGTKLSDDLLARVTKDFMCGRDLPFNADDIEQRAKS